jgi:hypothetical protein
VNGAWATAQKVPAPISTDASEVYPVVVADGSMYFLFFSRRQATAGNATAGDVYWMDAKFLEQFRR